MTTNAQTDRGETARLWAVRVGDPDFADWEAFGAWLGEDEANAEAYEQALAAEAWATGLLGQSAAVAILPGGGEGAGTRRWWRVRGMAAAAVLGLLISWSAIQGDMSTQRIATALGERRTVQLADGSRIVMNGGTQIVLDEDRPRYVELAAGEALFEVRHDDSHPFVVAVGETRLLDVGTVFNVKRDGHALDVAVAEGAVIYEPGPEEVRLDAGEALLRAGEGAPPMVRKALPEAIGGWRNGQLQFEGASLSQVARDLERTIGVRVRAGAGTGQVQFSGILVVDGKPEEIFQRAGPLLGVVFVKEGDGWTMTATHGSPG